MKRSENSDKDGWKSSEGQLLPVMSDFPPAPDIILCLIGVFPMQNAALQRVRAGNTTWCALMGSRKFRDVSIQHYLDLLVKKMMVRMWVMKMRMRLGNDIHMALQNIY